LFTSEVPVKLSNAFCSRLTQLSEHYISWLLMHKQASDIKCFYRTVMWRLLFWRKHLLSPCYIPFEFNEPFQTLQWCTWPCLVLLRMRTSCDASLSS